VPLIVATLVLVAVLILSVLLLPISIIQRYRVGTRRRQARGWVIALNLVGVGISIALFLFSSALMSAWLPGAFSYAGLGLMGGSVLGLLGLFMTRWETSAGGLHYTPPWPLVLAITLIISSRVLFGLWRGWHTWGTAPDATSWLQQSGATGSLAAGAAVLGYYFSYWYGVRWRARRLPPVRRMPRR
jgi:hypothetical protein